MAYVSVDINMRDISEDDLIEELMHRGYSVTRDDDDDDVNDEIKTDMDKVIQYFTYGNVEEAVIYLERVYPELYGLHKMIRKDT